MTVVMQNTNLLVEISCNVNTEVSKKSVFKFPGDDFLSIFDSISKNVWQAETKKRTGLNSHYKC